MSKISEIILLLAELCLVSADERKFPKDFLFGIASSSYQIEGAWNESGRGESIWDRFVHTRPDKILDGSNADIACDSYHKIKDDVKILKDLGVHFYRFSLSWPRILPNGYSNKINPDGIRYYNELINELLANGIQPMVTLYHWDLPQQLQEIGGWPNPFLANIFADFARVAFKNFGDRVKLWLTINEPYLNCEAGYQTGEIAPGYRTMGVGMYMCAYTLLLAHAKAYHIYHRKFRSAQRGKIGITFDTFWYEPKSQKIEDVERAELTAQMLLGIYAHPIFSKSGDWPLSVKQRIRELSAAENFTHSRLPPFSKKKINLIRGTSDFLGINHYSSAIIEPSGDSKTENMMHPPDTGVFTDQPDDWEPTQAYWIKIVPWGLRKLLNWIKKEYDNPPVFIMENGVADTSEEKQVRYYKGYLGAVLDAIQKDDCKVIGYTAWSLMDSFEWELGYTLHFGMYMVNFTDPDRKRVPRSSAKYYKKVIETRSLDHEYE